MDTKVYLLYTGNAWLNTSSLQLLAVCSSTEKAVELAVSHANDGDNPLDDEDVSELEINRQTYGRDDNYLICECNIDELD